MGDIHGAYKALKQCLERSEFDYAHDTLIQLGDVADGWSEVYECVDELLQIQNLIAIQGNHDEWTLEWMDWGFMPDYHRGQGGEATEASYLKHGHNDEHRTFFSRQQKFYVDEKERLFVHGGLNREYSIYAGNDIHNYAWTRALWSQAQSCKGDQKLTTYDNFREIFIGHTSVHSWRNPEAKPLYAGGVWNLDTGAGWSGKLTIMDVDTHEYWQSDFCNLLYENEAGRR